MARTRPHRPFPTSARLLAAAFLAGLAGCAGPAIRSQSPEIEALAGLEDGTRLVGDYTAPWGLASKRIEAPALITGLADTGSDPPPGPQRAALLADMQARGVIDPNTLLASLGTSLVWVHAYLPAGCRKGDRFDIAVEVPASHDTTSLAGGWLMRTRMAEKAVVGNVIRDGHELGIAEGALLVDPVSTGTLDSKSRIRAIVPGGGISLIDRELGLVIAAEHRSFAMSKRLGDWINRRFHTVIRGARQGVANPKTDRFIELEVPPLYRHNLPRYVRVIQCVAVIEPPEGRHARMQLLARQLADPVTAPAAALRLEAIGKDGIPILKRVLDSDDPEIRFAAAEALAYLGESVAARHLAEAARTLRSARPAALAALAVIDDANGIDALESLLTSRSAETRYGAFRALERLDPGMPLVRGEQLGDACRLHVLDVGGPPLIHSTRHDRPELVFFGPEHPVADGLRAEAGHSIVVVVEDATATVSRFLPGRSDQRAEVPADAAAIARAIIELGGGYPDAVQFLQQAAASRCLNSRLAFDALPNAFDGRPAIHEEASARETGDDADSSAAAAGRRADERS